MRTVDDFRAAAPEVPTDEDLVERVDQGRSNRADVRNPMLALASVRAFAQLPAGSAQALRAVLSDYCGACREKARDAWVSRDYESAALWQAVAVNARHLYVSIPADKSVRPHYVRVRDGGPLPGSSETRCTLAKLPQAFLFLALPADARQALYTALLEFSRFAAAKGLQCWRKAKPPMAAYYKRNGFLSRQLALAIRRQLTSSDAWAASSR